MRLMAGHTGVAMTRSLRISNRRFREATGWAPAVRNAIEGLTRVVGANQPSGRMQIPAVVRIGLWLMALFSLLAGIQQQFAPRFFYEHFPGFGMQWVSVDGPYNEHLLRDLGGANLAFAVLTFFAIARPSVGLVRAVAIAMLVAQVPHFIYHAAHLDLLRTPLDRVLQTASLALTLVIPLTVLLTAGRIGQQRHSAIPQPGGAEPKSAGQQPLLVASPR